MPEKKEKAKYIRNTTSGYLRVGDLIWSPRGKYGDAIPANKKLLDNEEISDLIKSGLLELTNEKTNINKGEESAIPVIKVDKQRNKVVSLATCLGVRDNGTFCQTQVTFIGDEKPPLCKDHMDQIDQIEFDPITGNWRRKE